MTGDPDAVSAAPAVIRGHRDDNVAVALRPLVAGERVAVDGTALTVLEPVPAGHTVALHDIAARTPVVMYGFPIGLATDRVPAGNVGTPPQPPHRSRGDGRICVCARAAGRTDERADAHLRGIPTRGRPRLHAQRGVELEHGGLRELRGRWHREERRVAPAGRGGRDPRVGTSLRLQSARARPRAHAGGARRPDAQPECGGSAGARSRLRERSGGGAARARRPRRARPAALLQLAGCPRRAGERRRGRGCDALAHGPRSARDGAGVRTCAVSPRWRRSRSVPSGKGGARRSRMSSAMASRRRCPGCRSSRLPATTACRAPRWWQWRHDGAVHDGARDAAGLSRADGRRHTNDEVQGYREIAIWKDGVTL